MKVKRESNGVTTFDGDGTLLLKKKIGNNQGVGVTIEGNPNASIVNWTIVHCNSNKKMALFEAACFIYGYNKVSNTLYFVKIATLFLLYSFIGVAIIFSIIFFNLTNFSN